MQSWGALGARTKLTSEPWGCCCGPHPHPILFPWAPRVASWPGWHNLRPKWLLDPSPGRRGTSTVPQTRRVFILKTTSGHGGSPGDHRPLGSQDPGSPRTWGAAEGVTPLRPSSGAPASGQQAGRRGALHALHGVWARAWVSSAPPPGPPPQEADVEELPQCQVLVGAHGGSRWWRAGCWPGLLGEEA